MAFASRHRAKWRRTSAWLVAVLLSCFAPTVLARDDLAADNVPGPEIIDMAPDQTVGWSLRNLTAPMGKTGRVFVEEAQALVQLSLPARFERKFFGSAHPPDSVAGNRRGTRNRDLGQAAFEPGTLPGVRPNESEATGTHGE